MMQEVNMQILLLGEYGVGLLKRKNFYHKKNDWKRYTKIISSNI